MPGNIHTIPLTVIASWPTPNYIDPERRPWMPEFAGILTAVSSLMVVTRLWLRTRKQAGALGLDDVLLIPAWLTSLGLTAMAILSAEKYGADRHVWDVQIQLFEPLTRTGWIAEIVFLVTTGCTKVSVLLFYRRLVEGTYTRTWKYATIAAIFFTIAYCVAFIFVLIFNCSPTDAYWRSYNPTYHEKFTCLDTTVANPLSGVLSVVSDFYSVLLPCLMLRHFDAPRRQKIALNIIFCLSLTVVAAGSVRTYYLNKLGYDYDGSWTGFNVFVWSLLETHLALMCASAPALRVFFRTYLSDPITRAINSARGGSAMRSNRDSRIAGIGSVDYTHGRSPTPGRVPEAKRTAASISTIDEDVDIEAVSTRSTVPSEPMVVRTPADFETYALQNLERNRPNYSVSPRPGFLRQASDHEFSHVKHSDGGWHAI